MKQLLLRHIGQLGLRRAPACDNVRGNGYAAYRDGTLSDSLRQ